MSGAGDAGQPARRRPKAKAPSKGHRSTRRPGWCSYCERQLRSATATCHKQCKIEAAANADAPKKAAGKTTGHPRRPPAQDAGDGSAQRPPKKLKRLKRARADSDDAGGGGGTRPQATERGGGRHHAPRLRRPTLTAAAAAALRTGSVVEALYRGRKYRPAWYDATVMRLSEEGTYDLLYEDGDSEEGVLPACVQMVIRKFGSFRIGMAVQAFWQGDDGQHEEDWSVPRADRTRARPWQCAPHFPPPGAHPDAHPGARAPCQV